MTVQTLNSMRIQRDTVALEFLSGGRLSELARNFFPKMVQGLHDFLPSFSPDQKPLELPRDKIKFLRFIDAHNYLNLSPLSCYVPQGLDVTYDEYIDRLDFSVDHAKQVIDNVLSPFTTYLSQLITNQDQKFNGALMDSHFGKLEQERKNANLAIGECFKNGSSKTEVKYGEVIRRNNDWEAVLHNIEHMSTELNRVDRKMLNKKVKECADLLDVVINKIKRGELDNASNAVVQNLFQGTFQVASEVEFFSVTYYRVDALSKSINSTIEKLQAVLKD